MRNNTVLIDFENVQKIRDEHMNKNTDIIIFVGLDQSKKAGEYTKTLLGKVSSVNLIKVDGRGNNALDFFLVFYLGTFYEKIKDKNVFLYLYSDDAGYQPLIAHLKGKGVMIEAIGKANQKVKNGAKTAKPKEAENLSNLGENITNKNYGKILKNIDPKTKKGTARPRPKTLKGLTSSIATWLKITKDDKQIEKIIECLKNDNEIKVDRKGKIEYAKK